MRCLYACCVSARVFIICIVVQHHTKNVVLLLGEFVCFPLFYVYVCVSIVVVQHNTITFLCPSCSHSSFGGGVNHPRRSKSCCCCVGRRLPHLLLLLLLCWSTAPLGQPPCSHTLLLGGGDQNQCSTATAATLGGPTSFTRIKEALPYRLCYIYCFWFLFLCVVLCMCVFVATH